MAGRQKSRVFSGFSLFLYNPYIKNGSKSTSKTPINPLKMHLEGIFLAKSVYFMGNIGFYYENG